MKPTQPAKTRAAGPSRQSSKLTGRGPTRTRPVLNIDITELITHSRPEDALVLLRMIREAFIRREDFTRAANIRDSEQRINHELKKLMNKHVAPHL